MVRSHRALFLSGASSARRSTRLVTSLLAHVYLILAPSHAGLTFQSSQPLPDHLIFREASSSTDDAAAAPGSSSAAQATTPSRATFPPSSYAALPPTPPPTSTKPTSFMESAELTEFTEMLALRETTCLRLRERTVRLDACGGLRTPSEDGEQGVRVWVSRIGLSDRRRP